MTDVVGALPSHPHHRPQAGEPAPPHRYPLLLVAAGVGFLTMLAGWVLGPAVLLVGVVLAGGGLAAFVLWPSPIDARAWRPPAAPMLRPDPALADAQLLAAGQVAGPEDLAIGADGSSLYASSFGDGRIVRIDLADRTVHEHARTGGSPVDLTARPDGSLLVCDWSAGLLEVSPDGVVSTLLPLGALVDGKPFVRPDGVSVAANGTVYVSEGSCRPGPWNGVFEALEAGAYGRVFSLDPSSGVTRTVVANLSFANGNAIEPGGSYLVVADQYRYRIARLWLQGPTAGSVDTFADNLPGLPHNLHFDTDGDLWAGLYRLRDATLDRVSPHSAIKRLLAKLPPRAVAGPERLRDAKPGRGGVVCLDRAGRIVHFLGSPPARVDTISAAIRHGDDLYVGTLTGDAILRVRLAG